MLVRRIDCCVAFEPTVAYGRRAASLPSQGVRVVRVLAHVARTGLGASLVVARLAPSARRARARGYAHGLLEAFGLRLLVRGEPLGETAPVLIAANHISWLDVFAVGAVSAAPFVAKAEVRGWPIVPRIAALFDTLFIDRRRLRDAARVKDEVAAKLRQSTAVTVFPESTTSDGDVLGRLYPALFQAAVETGAWVQPVAIRYRDVEGCPTPAPAFLGEMTILDSLRRIFAEREIVVELTFCRPLRASGRTRRELAGAAHAAIAAVLGFDCGLRSEDFFSPDPQSAICNRQSAINRAGFAR